MTLLSAIGLSKCFSGLQAVNSVDLGIADREIRAIIGPNGAGKTTLVGMLSGRIKPNSGRILFEGKDVTRLPAHKRISLGIAYTFQITSVFANLPILENVALAIRRGDKSNENAIMTRAHACLDRVGLRESPSSLASELSYGHQRILEIAMGLAQSPKLLILDEPTQGLAEKEISDFKILVRELSSEAAILLIEHNMDVVMDTAHVITVLNNGMVLAEGAPEEIRNDPAVQSAYLRGT